jgi:hypothetical protein
MPNASSISLRASDMVKLARATRIPDKPYTVSLFQDDVNLAFTHELADRTPRSTYAARYGTRLINLLCFRARWLREAGLMDREYKRWFVQRPKCDSDSRGFVSVRIADFYPTLVVLTCGIVGGTALLALEILYHKVRYGTYWPCNAQEFQSMVVKHRSTFAVNLRTEF